MNIQEKSDKVLTDIKVLLTDLSVFAKDAKEVAKTLVKEKASEAKETIADVVSQTKEKVTDLHKDICKKTVETSSKAHLLACENPWVLGAAALGVGLALGAILTSKRKTD